MSANKMTVIQNLKILDKFGELKEFFNVENVEFNGRFLSFNYKNQANKNNKIKLDDVVRYEKEMEN